MGMVIPLMVCEPALDNCGITKWDTMELYVFNEVTKFTTHFSLLCNAAETNDHQAIVQVADIVQLQHDLLQKSGCSTLSEFHNSILGPELFPRVHTWYFEGVSVRPHTQFQVLHTDSPPPNVQNSGQEPSSWSI